MQRRTDNNNKHYLKDHKIEITDREFKPNVLNVNPDDRIWFIWTETQRAHNIRQVTHRNEVLKDGFSSGASIDAPGAYMITFNEPGVYYFHSDNLKDALGAIVVMPEPTIHPINVWSDGISPDPLVANVNDAVVWIFPTEQQYDLVEIESQNDLLIYPSKAAPIIPRRCLSRSFKKSDIYHFASPSFNKALQKDEMSEKGYKVVEILFKPLLTPNKSALFLR
jgi:plastocyanin